MSDLVRILEHAPALSNVEKSIIWRLCQSATQRCYPRGEYLWRKGEQPTYYAVIRAGLIKVVRPGPGGRSALLGLFGAPDSVGEIAVLKGIPYPADAIVISESATIIEIPAETFLTALQDAPQMGISIAQGMHTKLETLRDKVDVLSAGSVDARLATLILKLYRQFGDDYDDGTSRIPVVLSRKELAELVSTSFETVIRTMTRWERDGVVATVPDGFILYDRAALVRAAGLEPEIE